jgi:hypothetical protein
VIAALQQRVDELERQLKDLQARLGVNASNSSLPPSANPPQAPPPVVKKRTGRPTGGQPGHQGHQRQRLPPERVQHVIALIPSHCNNCRAPLPQRPSAADPEPVWHQFAELPKVQAVVTEFQGHARTCPGCGHLNREAIPAEVRAHTFGPRLAAVLGYLSGSHHVSHRGLEEIAEVVFGVPLSLGTITALQEQMSRALLPAHGEIAEQVREAPAKHVDETGWKQAGQKSFGFGFTFGGTAWLANPARAACRFLAFSGLLAARLVFSSGSSLRLNSSSDFLPQARAGPPSAPVWTTGFQSPARTAPVLGVVLSEMASCGDGLPSAIVGQASRPSTGRGCSAFAPHRRISVGYPSPQD